MANPKVDTHKDGHHSPTLYIVGYILSIVLTVGAIWLVVAHGMSTFPLITTIVILAALQIFVQLFFFMHITETDGPAYNVMALILGAIFVVAIVGGSIWIMAFNSQVS